MTTILQILQNLHNRQRGMGPVLLFWEVLQLRLGGLFLIVFMKSSIFNCFHPFLIVFIKSSVFNYLHQIICIEILIKILLIKTSPKSPSIAMIKMTIKKIRISEKKTGTAMTATSIKRLESLTTRLRTAGDFC